MCSITFQKLEISNKQCQLPVVKYYMTNEEQNIIISVWNDMTLRMKLEDNPYSLTQDELRSLKNNDRLNAMLEDLKHDVLAQKAVRNSLKYHV